MRGEMRHLLWSALIALFADPALAQPASIETELVKGRCRFIEDDGEVGHYALKRCPGLNGIRVFTIAGVNQVSLSFGWGKAKPKEIVENSSIGTSLEWRGIKARGGFTPYATVVRVIVKDHEADERHNVLAVIRMEKRNACLMAALDEPGNPDPAALARATADQDAPGFSCATGKPRVVGAPSWWAQAVIGFGGDAPK
jgi:hypothetical protein